MLATMRAAAPRIGSPAALGGRRRRRLGRPGRALVAWGSARPGGRRWPARPAGAGAATGRGRRRRLRGGVAPVVGEEVLPALAHRRGVGEVLLVHLVDEPGVGPEGAREQLVVEVGIVSHGAERTGASIHHSDRRRAGRPVDNPASGKGSGPMGAAEALGRRRRDLVARPAPARGRRGGGGDGGGADRGHAPVVHGAVGVDRGRRRRPRGRRSPTSSRSSAASRSPPVRGGPRTAATVGRHEQRCPVHLHHAEGEPLPPARPRGAEGHHACPSTPAPRSACIGPNGSGKSSLLRIMAGVDDGFTGEARLSPGFTVGLLEQEPQLDATKDVKGNVMDGVAEVAGLLERYDAVLAKYADPDADYEKIGAEQAELEAKIEAAGAWDLERHDRDRHGRPAPAAGRRRRRHAVRRRAAPGGAVPAAAVAARPAAARRAHQPPRRRVGGVARADPARLPGHRRRHHPRPLLPRQRGPLDPRARARQGPSRSRATTRAGSSRSRPASTPEEKQRLGPRAARSSASSSGCAWRPRPARPRARPAWPPTRSCWPRPRRPSGAPTSSQIQHPAGPPPRRRGDRGRRPGQGLRRPAAHRRPHVHAAAGRHRRRHRPQRRRQDHAVPHDHRARSSPTPARSRSATPSSSPTSTRAATASTPTSTVYEEITGGTTSHEARQPRGQRPGLRRPASTSRAPTSRRRSACSPAASATGCTWPRC